MSDSILKPQEFFDEDTKDVVIAPSSTVLEKTQITANTPAPTTAVGVTVAQPNPTSATATPPAPAMAAAASVAPPPLPTIAKDSPVSVQIPAKLPEFTEKKSETSNPAIPSNTPNEETREPSDFTSEDTDSDFRSFPSGTQITNLLNGNFSTYGLVAVAVVLLLIAVFSIRRHGGDPQTGLRQESSDSSWKMNLTRSWLPFGAEPKSWNEFQKSLDQAMTDLSTEEK